MEFGGAVPFSCNHDILFYSSMLMALTPEMAQKIASIYKKWNPDQQANAMEKALAQWWAQGLAGNQWATWWQMAAIQAEINNKYAPQRASIEAQRQQAMAAAAQQEFSIPAQMQWIKSQLWGNTSSASSTYNSKKTDPYQNLPEWYFYMWWFIGTQAQRDVLDDKLKIQYFNANMKENREKMTAAERAKLIYNWNINLSI